MFLLLPFPLTTVSFKFYVRSEAVSKRNTLIKVVPIFKKILNKSFKSVSYYKLEAQLHIYPFHLFLLSISLIPYFNLCLKAHASVLQNTMQLPWKGRDRNVGVCAMAINAGSFLMSVAVESLTMFAAFCMAPVHKWKV